MSDAISSAVSAASTPTSVASTTEASSASNESSEMEATSTEEVDSTESNSDVESTEQTEVKPSSKKKYSLKVNNKIKDLELDLSNDEEIQKYLQKALAADEKFQEASSLRKQVEELVKELKENPLAVLRHESLGIDVKRLAEQVLNEEIEDLNKSPEQKKIEEMERRLKEYETEKSRLEDEKRQSEMARIQEEAFQELDDQITSALGKSDLPKSPYVVKRIADAMIEAVNMGYSDITVDQILPFVENQILGELNRLFEEAPEATADKLMEKLIGKKNLDRYRKSRVSKAKAKPIETAKAIKETGEALQKPAEEKEESPIRMKDLFKPF